jgi:hypothetical protein
MGVLPRLARLARGITKHCNGPRPYLVIGKRVVDAGH